MWGKTHEEAVSVRVRVHNGMVLCVRVGRGEGGMWKGCHRLWYEHSLL